MAERIINAATDPKIAALLKDHDQLVAKRLPYEPTMIEITQFIQPRLNNFRSDTDQGKKRTQNILDSSVQLALRRASEGYQSYMFPRSTPWFELELYPLELMSQQENAIWMKKARDYCLDELSRSDFYQEGGAVIDNGLGIGTSACYVEDSPQERCSQYLAMHPKEVYIARNRFGVVDTLHRRFPMTGRTILEQFDRELKGGGALTPKEIEDLEKNLHSEQPVIHITKPRTDRDAQNIGPKDLPWASIYLLENSQKLLRESGYFDFPFAVWCCLLNTDEEYGRSPSWEALPDVKRLQKIVRNILRATEPPPYFYPLEMDAELDLRPEGRNPYRDYQRKIEPIQTQINIQHAMLVADQIRKVIDDHYDVPFFLMFSMREKLQKTATEVVEIAGERAALMGTKVGRIESDFLDKVIQLTIRNSARAGRMPPPPLALRQQKDVELRINYIGPLATLQKRYHGQQNMTMTLAQAAPLLQAWPESGDVVNATASVRTILTKGGFPPEDINDEKAIKQIREKRAAEEQMIKTLAAMQAAGKAAPGLSQAPAPGSPMEKLGQAMGPEEKSA
jgi:hypothetical protein